MCFCGSGKGGDMFFSRCVLIFRKWRENGLKCEAISAATFARLREIFSSTHPYQIGISKFYFYWIFVFVQTASQLGLIHCVQIL